jgi:MFS transporter, SP family, arabinose:H+ symporter
VGDVIMDRLKRRTLLLIGAAGMAVSQWTLGGLLTRHDVPPGLQFFFLLSYVAFYEVSVGPLLWVLCSEMFPLR